MTPEEQNRFRLMQALKLGDELMACKKYIADYHKKKKKEEKEKKRDK